MNVIFFLKKQWVFLFILFISFLPLVTLFKIGLPLTHDGQDHVARIANFYQSLSEGNIVPRWANNLNWGYGHPILMFLYPLPSYIASLFIFVGFSFVDSTKIVLGLSFIASIFAMYIWIGNRWGKVAGITAAAIYGFSPYRFVDLYVRGAIGEHVAFVFPPLILYFLDQINLDIQTKSDKLRKKIFVLCLSIAGLILSHNALSMMFLPIICLYVLYLISFEVKKKVIYFVIALSSLIMGFVLSAFFWIPAFFEGKYTLRDIVTGVETMTRFVPWEKFFMSSWNYGGGNEFSKSLGIIVWMCILISLIVIKFLKYKQEKWFIVSNYLILLFSLFLMTRWSTFIWQLIPILLKFQFPWRLLSVSVFVSSVIGGIGVGKIYERYFSRKLDLNFVCLLNFICVITTFYMWRPVSNLIRPSYFYSGIYPGTTDTGESSPIWSVRFMEHLVTNPMMVADGFANITVGKRTTTSRNYQILANQTVRLVENTLFFPGWEIYIDGVKTEIEYQDPNYRGLMEFWIKPGVHNVKIVFRDTKVRKYSNYLSLAGFLILFGFLSFKKYGKDN
jgi:hypothetical protein